MPNSILDTNGQRHVRFFPIVRLSVVSVRGVHPIGGRSAMLHINFGEG